MSQNQRDAAPKGGARRASSEATGGAPAARQVADYLRAHPSFFESYPDLLDELRPPLQENGDGVTDLRNYMVLRLREEMERIKASRDELVVTARSNGSAQARVYEAILALLGARDFAHFIETLTTDLAVILDIDVVTVGVEQCDQDPARTRVAGVVRLEPKVIDRVLGPGQNMALSEDTVGDPEIFGAGAGLVRSQALLRLEISRSAPAALLALGSRQPDHFHDGQGTELLNFLGRVVETCIRGWLKLPE